MRVADECLTIEERLADVVRGLPAHALERRDGIAVDLDDCDAGRRDLTQAAIRERMVTFTVLP